MVDSTASNSKSDASDSIAQALNLFVQGKRHLVVRDYYSATQSLGEACKLFDDKYGKCADEAGEVYLFYGIALLELSRQETGALGGVVKAKIDDPSGSEIEDDEDEDDEEENEQKPDGEEESEQKPEVKMDGETTEGEITEEDIDVAEESKTKENDDKSKEQPECSSSNNTAAGPSHGDINDGPSTSQGTSAKTDEDEDSDEATDLEISWDVLTMATMVFKRQIEKGNEVKLKLAECLQKLGEIAIEWENNEQAIKLLEESLSIRKECLPEDDRLIAETYYYIGTAYSFMSEIEKANDCYRCAVDVIEKRIEGQRKLVAEATDPEVKSDAEIEIMDLEGVLPEMQAKIEDSRDQMSTVMDALKTEESERLEEKAVADKIKEVQAKPVNNVSHLVKRKRPSDGEPEAAKKRVCLISVPKDGQKSDVTTSNNA